MLDICSYDWELCKFEDILKSHPFKQYLAEPTEDGNFPVIQQGDKPIIGYSNGEPYEDFTHVTLFGDHTVSLFKPTKPFFVATDGVKILSVENFEGDYLFYVLEQYKPESQGYKRHFTILKNEKCFFTENKEEQIRIGNFLKKLDKTITLHQRKLEQLELLKKAYLQQMFPDKEIKEPRLRFVNFNEDWELCELGDLSSRVIEKNTERKYLTTLTNSAEFGIVNQQDFFDKDITNLENIDTYYIVKNNDFIYNPRISNFARVGPINRNKLGYTGVVSPLYNVFRTKNINILYLEFYFKTSYWHRFIKMNGDSGARSDRISIRILDFERMPIPYPIQEEQTKIGLFLDKLNTTIALHQNETSTLEKLKASYLQKMFI